MVQMVMLFMLLNLFCYCSCSFSNPICFSAVRAVLVEVGRTTLQVIHVIREQQSTILEHIQQTIACREVISKPVARRFKPLVILIGNVLRWPCSCWIACSEVACIIQFKLVKCVHPILLCDLSTAIQVGHGRRAELPSPRASTGWSSTI